LPTVADLCRDLPLETFEPGEVLMAEGETSGRLYVLVEGMLEIVKGDFQINVVDNRGAILGDMSVLLDLPHSATVRALTRSVLHVSHGGEAFLQSHQEIAYQLSKMLAQRLHGISTYLVDMKRQFAGEQSHLGMVDEILESLLNQQRSEFTPGSDRDPGY
jgi:CRP-like cAMP-binding protein